VARYDEIADFYEQGSGKSVSDPATAVLLDLAGDVSGLQLLEVACGPGRVARELARRGAALTGLDISAVLLATARNRHAEHQCVTTKVIPGFGSVRSDRPYPPGATSGAHDG
jgi:ubiquinone/menaquinone biosynthesis C-methylase UbiE